MMPDLGKYAFEVISAYGMSFLALAFVCYVYIRRSRSVKRALIAAEVDKGA